MAISSQLQGMCAGEVAPYTFHRGSKTACSVHVTPAPQALLQSPRLSLWPFKCCENKEGSSLTGKIFHVPLVCPSLDENTSLRARHPVKGPPFLARFAVGSQEKWLQMAEEAMKVTGNRDVYTLMVPVLPFLLPLPWEVHEATKATNKHSLGVC